MKRISGIFDGGWKESAKKFPETEVRIIKPRRGAKTMQKELPVPQIRLASQGEKVRTRSELLGKTYWVSE